MHHPVAAVGDEHGRGEVGAPPAQVAAHQILATPSLDGVVSTIVAACRGKEGHDLLSAMATAIDDGGGSGGPEAAAEAFIRPLAEAAGGVG